MIEYREQESWTSEQYPTYVRNNYIRIILMESSIWYVADGLNTGVLHFACVFDRA